jgi:hypothetical protein
MQKGECRCERGCAFTSLTIIFAGKLLLTQKKKARLILKYADSVLKLSSTN